MKFAIHTLVFYGADMLRMMVQNTGRFVDRIYVSHSIQPWNAYNKKAVSLYKSDITERFFEGFPFREKIVWLEGVWASEEDQRNHSLKRAREDGMDVMIIQDVDEFYTPEAFKANLEGIQKNPNYPAYRCPWTVFWKSLDYVLEVRLHGQRPATVTTCPNFAVNVKDTSVKFVSRRLVNRINEAYMLPGLCLHLSWVLSDEEVMQKISTWGHSHQFNLLKWYKHKWLAWQPTTKNIGNISRAGYSKAVPFTGALPPELVLLAPKSQQFRRLSIWEKLDCSLLDLASILRFRLSLLYQKVKRCV